MSKDGYYGDFESRADEEREYQKWLEQQDQDHLEEIFEEVKKEIVLDDDLPF